jgi:signal transduction histidine kinase
MFAVGIGLPGRVWFSREPVYIPDILADPNFLRAPIAAREGLHTALCFPILLGGDVSGAMEFFSREIWQPDQELLTMMATIGSQIGQFIERKRAEDALHRTQAELAHVTRVATLGEMTASIAHEVNQPLASVISTICRVHHRRRPSGWGDHRPDSGPRKESSIAEGLGRRQRNHS